MSTQSITATASSMAAPNPKPDTVKFGKTTCIRVPIYDPISSLLQVQKNASSPTPPNTSETSSYKSPHYIHFS